MRPVSSTYPRRVYGVTSQRDKYSIPGMAIFGFVFFVVVVIGVIAIDHRLLTLVKIQREIHKEHLLANAARTETVKALQWIVDKLAVMK
jgi:hypothetical protein